MSIADLADAPRKVDLLSFMLHADVLVIADK